MWRSLVSRLVRVQEAVGSNPATPTKNPQIFVQEAQKSEDSSFVKPGNLCETPTPGNAEKSDHRTDYLAEMLTRSKRRQDRQRGRCFGVSGLLLSPLSAALTSASPRSASLCLGVALFDFSLFISCFTFLLWPHKGYQIVPFFLANLHHVFQPVDKSMVEIEYQSNFRVVFCWPVCIVFLNLFFGKIFCIQ